MQLIQGPFGYGLLLSLLAVIFNGWISTKCFMSFYAIFVKPNHLSLASYVPYVCDILHVQLSAMISTDPSCVYFGFNSKTKTVKTP